MKKQQEKQKILIISLILSVLIGLIKFVTYFLTNSNSVLTDALESIINVFAGGFALYSIILAAKPKDSDHPYGHGKIEFISAGLEGSLIGFTGLLMILKSIYNLFYPQSISFIETGLYLTLFSGAANYFLGRFLILKGKKLQSITIEADGKHILSDSYTSFGLIIGLLLIYVFEIPWIDNVLAILLGVFILTTSYKLIRKSLAGVMDEADHESLREIISVLNKNRIDTWIDIHNMRLIKYGSDLHIDCHVTLPWYLNLKEAHEEIKEIEKKIATNSENNIEVFIHPDPCLPTSCGICQISDCQVRAFPFKRKLEWELKNLIENKKHEMEAND